MELNEMELSEMERNLNTMNTMAIKTPADFRKEFKRVRHKAEKPLYFLMVLLNLLIIGVLLLVPEIPEIFLDIGEDVAKELTDLNINFGIILLIVMMVLLLFACYQLYSEVISYAVRVTPKNFPEIHNASVEYAERMGLKKVPPVFIVQKNGVINAFASWVIGRRYIQLNAEIVDIAYMENKDFEVVKFVMAHEFGHVYMGHITFGYHMSLLFSKMIPLLGPMLFRAQEYSADRVAQLLTGNIGTNCMALLSVGRHLYAHVDPEDYIETINRELNPLEWLARFVENLLADHPIAPFRLAAIMDPEKKSGKLI